MAPIEVPRTPIGKHPASSRTSTQQSNVFILPSLIRPEPPRGARLGFITGTGRTRMRLALVAVDGF